MAHSVFLRIAMAPLFTALAALAAPVQADPVEDGQKIATAGVKGVVACATCHGAKGEGMAAAGFPYLAGQGAAYLTVQLQDFAKGTRHNPVMEPIAKGLTPEQIAAVSAYYAQLPPPFDAKQLSEQIDTYPDKGAEGAWLANRGDWEKNIPACAQCHGPGGIGVGEHFPALAGLSAQYIIQQLKAWKDKKRDPGPLSLMGDIANRMSETQITAVAAYFAGLPEAAKGATSKSQGAK